MASEYTRTGARRSGDDYQDIVALDALLDMLWDPAHYEWVQLEADEFGFLDDVVALLRDGSYVVRQVKFSTHPADEKDAWTWEGLLAQRKGANDEPLPSLLAKWAESLESIRTEGKKCAASVVSNRRAGADLAAVLSDGRVQTFALDADTVARIAAQLGSEKQMAQFFEEFRFDLAEPGLEAREEAARRRFYRLNGTEPGWLNLKDELRRWIRQRYEPPPDGKIRLATVKAAALWNQLEELPENFAIPDDYVLPSSAFHEQLMKRIFDDESSCQVVSGTPGIGKSTYLSYFVRDITKSTPVIRHHYFLSDTDRTPGRRDPQRIARSLMGEMQRKLGSALGDLAAHNPNPANLSQWLERCGAHMLSRNLRLVVVLDGLDHVWRESGSRAELDVLFDQLLPTPPGVALVVGTQPVDESMLPAKLVHLVPRGDWMHLPLLTKEAVQRWLRKHQDELQLPGTKHAAAARFRELVEALFEKSQGHPLHLRYTLQALHAQYLAPTGAIVASLPSCSAEGISSYYRTLWMTLPQESRQILYLLSACPFSWPQDGIVSSLVSAGSSQAAIQDAIRKVRHLLTDPDGLGLRPFHNSLSVFIADDEMYTSSQSSIKQAALAWLKSTAQPYWRWANEWLVEEELGNAVPLSQGPDRRWLVDSIVSGYPPEDTLRVLNAAASSALRHGQLARFYKSALYADYVHLGYEYLDDAAERLLAGPTRRVA